MAVGKILIILGALLTILGTYVFAVFLVFPGYVGSGLGFAMNLIDIIAVDPGTEAVVFYFMLVVLLLTSCLAEALCECGFSPVIFLTGFVSYGTWPPK